MKSSLPADSPRHQHPGGQSRRHRASRKQSSQTIHGIQEQSSKTIQGIQEAIQQDHQGGSPEETWVLRQQMTSPMSLMLSRTRPARLPWWEHCQPWWWCIGISMLEDVRSKAWKWGCSIGKDPTLDKFAHIHLLQLFSQNWIKNSGKSKLGLQLELHLGSRSDNFLAIQRRFMVPMAFKEGFIHPGLAQSLV